MDTCRFLIGYNNSRTWIHPSFWVKLTDLQLTDHVFFRVVLESLKEQLMPTQLIINLNEMCHSYIYMRSTRMSLISYVSWCKIDVG
jgi:hypothetical protein